MGWRLAITANDGIDTLFLVLVDGFLVCFQLFTPFFEGVYFYRAVAVISLKTRGNPHKYCTKLTF